MARLPIPGQDNGTWGDILNDYLSQSHNTDGTLKADSVSTTQIQDGTVNETQLSATVQTKLNASATPSWSDIQNKPIIIAAGATQAAARTAIDVVSTDTFTTALAAKLDATVIAVRSVTDEAGIRSAVTALSSTGGTIFIGPGTITLTAPLPLVAGIVYKGVPPTLDPVDHTTPAYLGDMEPNFVGGTILRGNGTFACFEANAADLGSPASPIGATQISNAGIVGVAIDNFTYGIHVGAKNTMGVVYGTFQDIYIKNCSQWGVKFVNFQHCEMRNIKTWICQNSQWYGSDIAQNIMMGGNSTIDELFSLIPRDGRNQQLCRNIVFDSGTGDSILNELKINRIQVNAFKGVQLSVTCTFTNGSANIGVPDGTRFAIDMPVLFTSSANGFTANVTYLVASVAGNVITIKNQVGGTSLNASGATSLTLQSWGFANIEITSRGTGGVRHSQFGQVDVEGAATAAIYIDSASIIDINFGEHPVTRDHDVVIRNSDFLGIHSMDALKTDFDTSGTTAQVSGQRERIIGFEGTGMWLNSSTGGREMSLTGDTGSAQIKTGDGGFWHGPIGEQVFPGGYSGNLDPGWMGHAVWGESSDTVRTIVDPTTNRKGVWHQVSAVGTGKVTVTTTSSAGFNKNSSLTSIVVHPGETARFTCVASDDAVPFWLVTKATLATD